MLVQENRNAIADATSTDFGQRSRYETELLEINHVLDAIRHSLKYGRHWMKRTKRNAGYKYWPGQASILPQPLGVIGVVVPGNYPLELSLGPANSAMVAGNRIMIKLSELTPRFGALLAELVSRHFDAQTLSAAPPCCLNPDTSPTTFTQPSSVPCDPERYGRRDGRPSQGREPLYDR